MHNITLHPTKGYKHIHFIGIGGVHMNGLAQLLNAAGYIVSGSDQKKSELTDKLEKSEITVYIGHSEKNIASLTDLVVYTAAVKSDNVEIIEAKRKKIDLLSRAELLGMVMKSYQYPICISGTHGKTGTTSMISEIFMADAKDPTILVGGYLSSIDGTVRNGSNQYMIVESCEYYDSFLQFHPYIGIILNMEIDHTDYFKDLEAIRASFRKFAELIPPQGTLVIHSEINNVHEITQGLRCNIITYDLYQGDWTAKNISYNEQGYPRFEVYFRQEKQFEVQMSVPGEHNILDALSAIATAHELGVSNQAVITGLNNYIGAKRRFQYKGELNGVTIIDDYAHHPTEIRVNINSAKKKPHNQLWCVFQPHTHSRTKAFLQEFAKSFDDADKIVILDIYSPVGREEPSTHVHANDLVELIKNRGKEVYYLPSFYEAEDFLLKNCCPNDLLITMGAGDVNTLSENMLKHYNL